MAKEPDPAVAYWQRNCIAPGTKPHACPFCGHAYLKPCEGDEHQGCGNFKALQQRKARRPPEEAA
jgi:rRNA maturation endonuclease Nob1